MHSWRVSARVLPLLLVAGLLTFVLVDRQSSTDDVVAAVPPVKISDHAIPLRPSEPAATPDAVVKPADPGPGATTHEPSHEHTADVVTVAELPDTTVEPFSMVGVTWRDGLQYDDTTVDVRWRKDGTWSAWTGLDLEIDDYPGSIPGTEPQWVGAGADGVAVRVDSTSGATPAGLKVTTLDPGKSPAITPVAFTTAATGSIPQPKVITRAQWGASNKGTCDSPVYGATTLGAVVHHTAGSNTYTKTESASIVKATQAYHQNSRGWCDIGYNVLVDKYGQIFEGRKGGLDKSVRAAHSGNDMVNQETMGVSMMGTFQTTEPSAAMKAAVADIIAWRFSDYGIPAKGTYKLGGLTLNRIAGHRNVVSTECPGAKAYAWLSAKGGLRDVVEDRLAGGGYTHAIPTGLSSTSQTQSSLTLDWADVPSAPEYRVQLSTNASMSGAVYYRFTTSTGTISGLAPNTPYYFRVAVIDPASGAKLSDYTQTPYPSASTWTYAIPSGLKATSVLARSLTLDWADVPDAPEYRVQYSASATMSGAKYASFTASTGKISGLEQGTKYYYRVAVVEKGDGAKLSDYTQTPYPSATTVTYPGGYDYPVPASLITTAKTSSSLTLDWADVAEAPEYRVQYSTSSTMSGAKYASFTASTGKIGGLKQGTKYYYRVAVVEKGDGAKLSDYTQTPYPSATTPTNPGGYDLPVPESLTSTAQTPSSLTLDWADVPGAPEYRVQYSTASSMSGAKYASFTASAGKISGLKQGTRYYYRVAVVEKGNGAKLSDYTQTPYPSATTPSYPGGYGYPVPASLTSTAQTPSSLTLDWADVSGAPEYRVQYSTASSMSGAKYASFTASGGTLSGLKASTKYYYRVAVVEKGNGAKLSDYTQTPYPSSLTKAANLGGYAYAIPTGLKSTAQTASALTLDWADVSGAPEYRVQYSTASSMSGAKYASFTASTGTISGLKASTKYYYRVAVVEKGNGAKLSDYTQTPYPSSSTKASSTAGNKVTVPSSRTVSFKGHGYGHGIGMSQYGAEGGAREGKSYSQILSTYYPGTALSTKTGDIRVLLSSDTTDSVMIEGRSGLVFRNVTTNKTTSLPTTIGGKKVIRWSIDPLASDKKKSTLRYRVGTPWVTYDAMTWTGPAQFESSSPMELVMPNDSNRTFRDTLRSSPPKAGATNRDTVNVLSLEDYTRGVVAREMPSSWHAEALKAQSVAARTYGVRGLVPSRYYDICDTTSCQVYGGVDAETAATDAAVKATAGKILTYQGKPALTQFSSSSGGYTNDGGQPYLKPVNDPWDGWSGNANHSWTLSVKASTVESKYPTIGTLKSIEVTKRSGYGELGGRTSSLKLVGSKATKTITGVDARWAFGLRSDWFGF